MSITFTRKLATAGLLSLCVAGLSIQAQTASPGPPSRNANVDREDPNKPDTPEHEIPNQEAPGSGNNDDRGAAGESTPTGGDGTSAGGDGSSVSGDSPASGDESSATDSGRPATERQGAATGGERPAPATAHDPTQPIPRNSAEQNAAKAADDADAADSARQGAEDKPPIINR